MTSVSKISACRGFLNGHVFVGAKHGPVTRLGLTSLRLAMLSEFFMRSWVEAKVDDCEQVQSPRSQRFRFAAKQQYSTMTVRIQTFMEAFSGRISFGTWANEP
jgi:hypothetical protein